MTGQLSWLRCFLRKICYKILIKSVGSFWDHTYQRGACRALPRANLQPCGKSGLHFQGIEQGCWCDLWLVATLPPTHWGAHQQQHHTGSALHSPAMITLFSSMCSLIPACLAVLLSQQPDGCAAQPMCEERDVSPEVWWDIYSWGKNPEDSLNIPLLQIISRFLFCACLCYSRDAHQSGWASSQYEKAQDKSLLPWGGSLILQSLQHLASFEASRQSVCIYMTTFSWAADGHRVKLLAELSLGIG